MVFVGIAGLIGVGKSTLATNIVSNNNNWKAYYEGVSNNPYLMKFYEDPSSVAYPMQFFMLNRRTKQHFKAFRNSKFKVKNTVEDRTIYEDVAFVKMLHKMGTLTDIEASTYLGLAENIHNTLPIHDHIFYLVASPEVCYNRILSRKRSIELDKISLTYLQDLDDTYRKYMKYIDSKYSNVHVIDASGSPDDVWKQVNKVLSEVI